MHAQTDFTVLGAEHLLAYQSLMFLSWKWTMFPENTNLKATHNFENRRTIHSYFDFGLKNSSLRLPYQRPNSSADCANELFEGSNGSASLVDCTRKKIFGWGVRIFCDWRHKW